MLTFAYRPQLALPCVSSALSVSADLYSPAPLSSLFLCILGEPVVRKETNIPNTKRLKSLQCPQRVNTRKTLLIVTLRNQIRVNQMNQIIFHCLQDDGGEVYVIHFSLNDIINQRFSQLFRATVASPTRGEQSNRTTHPGGDARGNAGQGPHTLQHARTNTHTLTLTHTILPPSAEYTMNQANGNHHDPRLA